jgi:hypothetical protein
MKHKYDSVATLQTLGIDHTDAVSLRRISMTLHRWHELECGDTSGCIERDASAGRAMWLSAHSGKHWPTGPLARVNQLLPDPPLPPKIV